jgi:signal transduction histidine kinase
VHTRLVQYRYFPVIIYVLVLLLFPVTAITMYVAQVQKPMPELYVLANNPSLVYQVYPGSGAEGAGVRAGDVIRKINGQPFNPEHLSLMINKFRIGQLLNLELERNGRMLQVDIPLISVRDIVVRRFTLFSTVAFILWVVSALLIWKRFQRIDLLILFLLCQTICLGLLFPYVDVITWFSTSTWAIGVCALGGMLSALFLFHFNISYPVAIGTGRQRKYLLTIIYTLGLILFIVWAFHNFTQFIWHPIGNITSIYIAIVVTAAIFVQIYIYFKHASPDGRRSLRLIMLGEFIAGIPAAILYLGAAVVLGYALIPEWLLMLFFTAAPLMYAIAIFKNNLFNIDRILNHSLANTITLLVIIIFLLAPIALIFWLMGSWPGSIFLVAGLLFLAFIFFERARLLIQHLVDRFFFGGWYDYPRVVEGTSDALAGSLVWEQLVDILTQRVPTLMQLHGAHLQIEEQSTPKLDPSLQPRFNFPLTFENQICGEWIVGPRRDGQYFSSTDLRILNTLGHQAVIAVNNMLLVKGMQNQLTEIRANRELLAHIDRQLLTAREEERTQLARDLHDGPVQSLISLNVQLGML